MEPPQEITLGTRLLINNKICTVRWIGELEGLPEKRLGIEWDDVSRGKHSGEYDGKQYFKPMIQGAASFIKFPNNNNNKIKMGISFWKAVENRYLNSEVEDVAFNLEDKPNVRFETVGFKKAQKELSNSKTLKVISLKEEAVSWVDPNIDYSSLLIALEDLDLTKSLLSSIEPIAFLIIKLKNLTTLRLNDMRIKLTNFKIKDNTFEHVKLLTLNNTLITEQELRSLEPYLKNLEELQFCNNRISKIPTPSEDNWFPNLKILNLESNFINCETNELFDGLKTYTSLENLNMGFNPIDKLYLVRNDKVYSNSLKMLNLDYINIKDIQQLNRLYINLPNLEHLKLLGAEFSKEIKYPYNIENTNTTITTRSLLIAFIPKLQYINYTKITPRERTDAELFYLNQICAPQLNILKSEEFNKFHPQFNILCKKYDLDLNILKSKVVNKTNKLKERLVKLNVTLQNHAPESNILDKQYIKDFEFVCKEFLNNITVRSLSLSIKKIFKLSMTTKYTLYALISNSLDEQECNELQVIELDNPIRQLTYFYGLKTNDCIWVHVE